MRLEEAAQHREYSTVERRTLDGRQVYVKQHLPRLTLQSSESVRAQMAREVDLVRRLSSLPQLTGRLGVLKIVEDDVAQAQMVMEQAPGDPLQDILRRGDRRQLRGTCVRAFFLAGKWLRAFQQLPVNDPAEATPVTSPQELVDYCDFRLERLKQLGFSWLDTQRRDLILAWIGNCVASTAPEHRQQSWCHGDYGPFNLMWDGTVLTPIDFGSCGTSLALSDLNYLAHRIEMLALEMPLRRWPTRLWQQACLRGYGSPNADQLPVYRALTMQRYISRLKKNLESTPATRRKRLHLQWCRKRIISKMQRLLSNLDGVMN